MKIPSKKLEKRLFAANYSCVIGVDEVGMGCLAGPVIACAVSFDKNFFSKKHPELSHVKDSKMLSPKQREELVKILLGTKGIQFAIAKVSPKIIDKINIYQASKLAMQRAVKKLISDVNKKILNTKYELQNTIVLVDGPHKITGLNLEQLPIIKGDQKVFSISCASILAKVVRDKIMQKLSKKYPDYGLEKHKGYGTKLHLTKLTISGPCEIHRKSFAPVAKLL